MEKQKTYEIDIKSLAKLVREFQADNFDGFVSNDESWIELWMMKYERAKKLKKMNESK